MGVVGVQVLGPCISRERTATGDLIRDAGVAGSGLSYCATAAAPRHCFQPHSIGEETGPLRVQCPRFPSWCPGGSLQSRSKVLGQGTDVGNQLAPAPY